MEKAGISSPIKGSNISSIFKVMHIALLKWVGGLLNTKIVGIDREGIQTAIKLN